MKKTMKEMVKAKILTAEKAKVGRRMMYVLPGKAIRNLSATPDSATRRLREMAEAYGNHAYDHQGGDIVIEPKFYGWVKKN